MAEENKTVDPFQAKAAKYLSKARTTDKLLNGLLKSLTLQVKSSLVEVVAQFGATMYAQGVIDGNKLQAQKNETVEVTQCQTCDGRGRGRGWVGIHDHSGQTQEMCEHCDGRGYN